MIRMGANYVAVDIMGARKFKEDEARQAAVVLRRKQVSVDTTG